MRPSSVLRVSSVPTGAHNNWRLRAFAAVFPAMGRMEMWRTRRSILPSDTQRMTRASSDRGRRMPGMLPASYARIDSSPMDSRGREEEEVVVIWRQRRREDVREEGGRGGGVVELSEKRDLRGI